VDPFTSGQVLSRARLRVLLRRVTSSNEPLTARLLEPSPVRLVLLRILMNLRGIYASRGELSRLLVVLSRILELRPDSASQWRDRGFLAAKLGAPRAAIADLQQYMTLVPEAGDVAEVRRFIDNLSDQSAPAN
jgi:regulator of sirC expression with transglutaminase-like and TPR domain